MPCGLVQVLGAGPTVFNPPQVVEVEDSHHLDYVIPNNTFQLNKPYGSLVLSAQLQAGNASVALPSWLSFNASGGLSGTPTFGSDQAYQLNITATDSDGAFNSTILQLEVRAACPPGLFRYFQLSTQSTNNPSYWAPYQNYAARSLLCSLTWTSSDNASEPIVFPSSQLAAVNISGTTYAGSGNGDPSAAAAAAFQDSLDKCQISYQDSEPQGTWKVRGFASWASKGDISCSFHSSWTLGKLPPS